MGSRGEGEMAGVDSWRQRQTGRERVEGEGQGESGQGSGSPIPESLTRWGQRWGQTGTNAQWEGLSGLRGVTRHLRERVELDIWKI